MKISLSRFALFHLLIFSLLGQAACGDGGDTVSNDSFYFTPLSSNSGLPGNPIQIQSWIDNEDTSAMASHALQIWGALNQDSGQIFQGRMLPVWETWYSGDEVYDSQTLCSSTQRPSSTTNFETPRQFSHTNVADENISSMNKFDGFYANNVCDNLYNNPNVLTALNASFTDSTPILERSIQGFATGTTALKPVFILVNQSGYTSIPYWEGAENSTNFQSPASNTWNQCVAVNPSLEESPFSHLLPQHITQACNGVNVTQPVFSMNDFYHFQLTQADIDNFGANASGEMAGAQPGDYAVLVAMHITMKEIPQWTWQTFWWHPNPDTSPAPAIPRPTEALNAIPAPFNHYAMCTAYQMVVPEVSGTPLICFNPYLEPGLVGVVGKESNCMTCHSYATWGDGGDFGGGLNYQANGFVDQGGDIFSEVTKLDFLWSVTRASDNSSN